MTQSLAAIDKWVVALTNGLNPMSVEHLEAWLTKRELARVLRCSTRTIERLRLPALRVGGQNRYRLSEVEAHLRAAASRSGTAER